MTTKLEIAEWFQEGVQQRAAYMIVWVDRFDNDDYPIYYLTKADTVEALRGNGQNMQSIMECYDLNAPLQPQLNRNRAWPADLPTYPAPAPASAPSAESSEEDSRRETDRTPVWELAPGHTLVIDAQEVGTVQAVTKLTYGYSVDLGAKRLYLTKDQYVDTLWSAP